MKSHVPSARWFAFLVAEVHLWYRGYIKRRACGKWVAAAVHTIYQTGKGLVHMGGQTEGCEVTNVIDLTVCSKHGAHTSPTEQAKSAHPLYLSRTS